MNTAPSVYLTAFCCEHHTLSVTTGGHYRCKSQSQRRFMTPVLVFQPGLGKCPAEDLQIKTGNERWADRNARSAVSSVPRLLSFPLVPFSLLITALPFVLPSVIFIAPSLFSSLSDEDIALQCCLPQVVWQSLMLMGSCVKWVKEPPLSCTDVCLMQSKYVLITGWGSS